MDISSKLESDGKEFEFAQIQQESVKHRFEKILSEIIILTFIAQTSSYHTPAQFFQEVRH